MIHSQAKEILSEDIWTVQDVSSYDDSGDIKPPVDMTKLREVVDSYRNLLTLKERRNRPSAEFFKRYHEDIQHILKSYDESTGRQHCQPNDIVPTFLSLIGNALSSLNILNLPLAGTSPVFFAETVQPTLPNATNTTTMDSPPGMLMKQTNSKSTSAAATNSASSGVSSSIPSSHVEHPEGTFDASAVSLNGNNKRLRRPIKFKISAKCSKSTSGSVRNLETPLNRKKDQQKETKPRRFFVKKN